MLCKHERSGFPFSHIGMLGTATQGWALLPDNVGARPPRVSRMGCQLQHKQAEAGEEKIDRFLPARPARRAPSSRCVVARPWLSHGEAVHWRDGKRSVSTHGGGRGASQLKSVPFHQKEEGFSMTTGNLDRDVCPKRIST